MQSTTTKTKDMSPTKQGKTRKNYKNHYITKTTKIITEYYTIKIITQLHSKNLANNSCEIFLLYIFYTNNVGFYADINIIEIKTNIIMIGNNRTNQAIPGAPALQIKFKTQVQNKI